MGVQKGQSGQPFLAHGGLQPVQVGLQAAMVPLHLLFSERSLQLVRWLSWTIRMNTVHSVFFSKTLFDFKKSISGLIELKFSGKTPNEVLYAPIYFWGVYF